MDITQHEIRASQVQEALLAEVRNLTAEMKALRAEIHDMKAEIHDMKVEIEISNSLKRNFS